VRRHELTIALSRGAYRALGRFADREERSVEQQASYLLRRALESMAIEARPVPDAGHTSIAAGPRFSDAVEAAS
jgi:hypothetical protein